MNLHPNSQTNLYGLQDNLLVFAKLFDQKKLPSKILLTGQKTTFCCIADTLHYIYSRRNAQFSSPTSIQFFAVSLDLFASASEILNSSSMIK